MTTLKTGIDHYQIISDHDCESDPVPFGSPCILADEETGDMLYAHLDIPAEDGSIRGAMGLGAVVYRLQLPDQEEETAVEDLPDGFDFEQEEDYESPFATDDGDERDLPNRLSPGQGEDEEDEEDGEDGSPTGTSDDEPA